MKLEDPGDLGQPQEGGAGRRAQKGKPTEIVKDLRSAVTMLKA